MKIKRLAAHNLLQKSTKTRWPLAAPKMSIWDEDWRDQEIQCASKCWSFVTHFFRFWTVYLRVYDWTLLFIHTYNSKVICVALERSSQLPFFRQFYTLFLQSDMRIVALFVIEIDLLKKPLTVINDYFLFLLFTTKKGFFVCWSYISIFCRWRHHLPKGSVSWPAAN